jgi:hypothetical protein
MENRVEQIKETVTALVNEAIQLLEKEYDLNKADINNPAYSAMMDLNSALFELDFLNEESLKLED